jgi:dihydrolipoamide dehydrogenase
MPVKTNLAIIGAGPGGYVAALRAAQLGMEVTIVETAHLGGVCLNRGCIPTKTMLQTAAVAHQVAHANMFGVMLDCPVRIDYEAALARRDAVVKRLKNGVRGLLKHGNVQVLPGYASFTGPRMLRVEPVSKDIGAGKGYDPRAGGDRRGRPHHHRHWVEAARIAGPRGGPASGP